jgi:hypothetical protein
MVVELASSLPPRPSKRTLKPEASRVASYWRRTSGVDALVGARYRMRVSGPSTISCLKGRMRWLS